MPHQVDAATLARESLYICAPNGFTAYRCNTAPSDHELSLMGLQRVIFKPIKRLPPVCPVNGAEGGDEPYWVRVPHRPDGMQLQYG